MIYNCYLNTRLLDMQKLYACTIRSNRKIYIRFHFLERININFRMVQKPKMHQYIMQVLHWSSSFTIR